MGDLMKDIYKTKKQLIKELEDARREISRGKAERDSAGAKLHVSYESSDYQRDEWFLALVRKAVDSTADAIALSDSEGRHIYHNKAFIDLFEYTVEDMKSAGGSPAIFAVGRIAREVLGSITSGRSWVGEVEARAKSGREFGVYLHADAIKDDSGIVIGLVLVFTDITERKLVEYKLKRKHDELQLILDSIPAYVFYKDKDGKMLNINKAAAALAYVPKEKLLNKTVYDLVPDSAEGYNRDDMEVIRSGKPKKDIEESLKLRGGTRWLKTDKLPIKDDDGNTVGLLGFSVDITDRKKAEEELAQGEALLRGFFNSPGLICGVVEIEGDDVRYITVNTAFADMYKLKPEDVSGRLTSDIGTERNITALFIENYRKSQKTNNPVYFEYNRGSGAETRWLSVMVTYLGLESSRKKPRFAFITSDITERRKAEEAFHQSEIKYHVLTDKMTDIIWTMDMNLQTTYVSPSITRILGYTPEERLVQPVQDQLTPESYEYVVRTLSVELERDGAEGVDPDRSVTIEVEYYRKDGSTVWMENVVSAIRDERGRPVMLHGVSRDITERKKAEETLKESEARMHSLFDVSPDVIMNLDRQGKILFINRVTTRTIEETVGTPVFDYIPPEYHAAYAETIERVFRTGEPEAIEIRGLGPGKRVSWYEARFVTLESAGHQRTLMVAATDITERKKAEEALKESEQKLRWMFESMKEGIFIVGIDGKVLDVNTGVEKITGYGREQLLGRSGLDYIFPGFKGDAMGMLKKMVERGGTQKEAIVPMKTAAGDTIEVEATSTTLKDSSGEPIGLIGIFRDVSERKRMENALRDSEEKLRLMFSSMADGVVVTDLEGRIIDVNEAQMRMFGYKEKSELIGEGGFDFLAERERGRALAEMAQVYEKGINTGSTYTVVDRNGREFECELSTAMLHDAAGKPSGTVTVMRDVTERRLIEHTLRESEERYRLLAENVTDIIWTMDLNLRFTYISPSVLNMRGYTAEEALGMSLEETVAPGSMKAISQVIKEEFEVDHSDQYTSRTIEVELRCKDGSMVWTEMKLSWLHDADGNRIGIMGVTRDITERRKVAEVLRETSEKLQVIFDSIGEAVTVVDMNGSIIDANKEALRLHGFNSKDAIVGRKSSELVAPIDRDRAIKDAIRALRTSVPSSRNEYKLVDVSGKEFDGEFNVAVIRGEGGEPAGFIGVARDISERKLMEEALRNSEERYRSLVENASEIIFSLDAEGRITYISPSVETSLGYKPAELIGHHFKELILQEDFTSLAEGFGRTLRGEKHRDEVRVLARSGDMRIIRISVKAVSQHGKMVGLTGVATDITERKLAEEALQRSEEKLRVMFDSMMDGIVVSDKNLAIVDVNRAAVEIMDVKDKEELLGRNAMEVIRIKDQAAVLANLEKMFREERPQEKVEYGVVLPSGKELEIEVSTAVMKDSAGDITGFVNAVRDISERKQWENALRNSEEQYRNLVEREKDVIVSVDALGFVKSVNSAVMDWGYTQDEVLKMNFLELIAPEWREVTARDMQQRLLETGEHVGETMVVRKDGEEKPIEYSAVVIQEKGKYAGAQAIVRDISERKRAEEALEAKERYFRAITDLSSGAALVVNQEGIILDVTGGLERISGHTREGTVGRPAIEFIHPDDLKKSGAALEECFRSSGKTIAFEARLKNSRGEWQWTESMLTNLLNHPDVHGIVNHLVDITARKKAEEEIKGHARRIEALYSVSQVISHASTMDTMLSDSLERVCRAMDTEAGLIYVLDLDENSLKLKSCRGIEESVKEQFSTIALTEQGIENIMKVQGPVTDVDGAHTVADTEGVTKVTEEIGRKSLAVTPLFSGNELQGFLIVSSSKERKFGKEELDLFKATANEISIGISNMTLLEKTRALSVTDELTRLYNRRYFFEMLDVEINRSGRTNRPFSLVMIDLDGFKEYNDRYGHSNGDTVLETFAQVLMASIRKSDLAFRYGGDEFALVLTGVDGERAKKIVQRMREKWQKASSKQTRGSGGQVGFSSGIAEYPANAESPDGLIFLADAALYQAKRKGYEDKLVSELRTLSTNIIDVATQDQVYALAATVDARDPYTYGHSQRVADTVVRIGRAIGLSAEDLAKLHAAALLHDIGKVGVPDAILTKPGKPSSEEWDLIRKHCAEGARIVGYVKEMSPLVPIVLHHHEWYDGSGYPAGLKGLEIPPGARITSVADAYDTMVTKRPYRDAITPAEACKELRRSAGTQFDPVIVDIWCKLVEGEEK